MALEHQLRHAEARAFSSGKHRDSLVNIFAAEQELGKKVAQLCADIPHRNLVESGEDSLILVKNILLVLGIVSDINVVACPGLSSKRLELACDNSHQGRLPLSVSPDECHLLPSLYLHIGMAENHLLRIAHSKVGSLEDDVSGTWRRREFHHKLHIVSLVYLDSLKFFKRLDAGLDLVGLGRLISERLDEILGFLDHLLLVFVCRSLLLDSRRTQVKVLAVWHFIVMDVPKHYFDSAVRYRVEETPVMAHEWQRTFLCLKVVLKPLDRFN